MTFGIKCCDSVKACRLSYKSFGKSDKHQNETFFLKEGAKENNDLENEMTHDFSSFFFTEKGTLPMIMIVSLTKKEVKKW